MTPAKHLAPRLRPCGPIVDVRAAERAREALAEAAEAGGWLKTLDEAWAALEPVFAASPYLLGLARRRPEQLRIILQSEPRARLRAILDGAVTLESRAADAEAVSAELRRLKAELHLLSALCDLGGIWDLDMVTGALSDFADAAVRTALASAAAQEIERGRLRRPADTASGPVPGLFVIAMGKHGARELNYSSDIDISVFYDPERLLLADGAEVEKTVVRLTQAMAALLQDRTHEGYVFRVDLRLRPDPSSTPLAVSTPAALDYYETVGQNWERAAFIKARAAAGDLEAAAGFLEELQAFIWRRNLDFAAIADIHSIKRQIHVHKVDDRLTAPGANLKLGHGGIREIEFYVQTQQLILGGRDPSLRCIRTADALKALAQAGHIEPAAAKELTLAYVELRALEHRVQMLHDEQTHRLPEADGERRMVAALYGVRSLKDFDAKVEVILKRVNARYGELFPEEEQLSSRFGSLVFTGVEDDPETLQTLKRMGFSNPHQVSETIRAWHHGHIGATRTERGRELFTRLAPRLLDALQATGTPDAAFLRFGDFFSGLTSGVQLQSMFLAQPRLFQLVVEILAFAPELARTLSRNPAAIDAMLDRGFYEGLDRADLDALARSCAEAMAAHGFEAAMDAVRRAHREQAFRIGVQVLSGSAAAADAGPAFAGLADVCIRALAAAALKEVERIGGAFPGEVAVVALGKAGSREMTAGSDLDLMTLYSSPEPGAQSTVRGWAAETFYARFTQRLVSALSAPTAEGGLYTVDMRLRPSGTQGPVAVSLNALQGYYEGEAETWEFLALTRARVVWSTSPAFAEAAAKAIETALRRPRDAGKAAKDVKAMRALLEKEKPAKGFWDLKLSRGGLVDIEFTAQYLQIVHAAAGGPLLPHTGEALAALMAAELVAPDLADELERAWRLQQDLSQVLKIALPEGDDPSHEPEPLRALLAKAGHAADFKALAEVLRERKAAARRVFEAVLG
ncbi:MAG: bifunctional [glutamine synthetase] adenylyltransferase/[glutamine synthetase]-adenylyl-L-tyrosine phosphorylase [Caulobacteraceae bacterium]